LIGLFVISAGAPFPRTLSEIQVISGQPAGRIGQQIGRSIGQSMA
jgi:hypothetical protein